MTELFRLDDRENAWMRGDIEETVNESIGEALRKNLYSADVTIRIGVRMTSVGTEDGGYALVPEYEYKSGYKIGGKYDRGKGKAKGTVGVRIGPGGYVETVPLPEQMKIGE